MTWPDVDVSWVLEDAVVTVTGGLPATATLVPSGAATATVTAISQTTGQQASWSPAQPLSWAPPDPVQLGTSP